MARSRLSLCLIGLIVLVATPGTAQVSAAGSDIAFARQQPIGIQVRSPGAAKLSDSSWALLWDRYQRSYGGDSGWVGEPRPRLRFADSTYLAVSLGPANACMPADYVKRIMLLRDTVVVYYGNRTPEGGGVCAAVDYWLEIAAIGRNDRPVVFRPIDPQVTVPSPPDWWLNRGIGQVDPLNPGGVGYVLAAHARDPRTTLVQLLALAEYVGRIRDWALGSVLIMQPRIRASRAALAALVPLGDAIHPSAASIVLTRHAEDVVRDPAAPRALLGVLVSKLPAPPADSLRAHLLGHHPGVVADSVLLYRLLVQVRRYPDLCNWVLGRLRRFASASSQSVVDPFDWSCVRR